MGEGKMGWEERRGRGKDRVGGGGEGVGWVEEGMGGNQYGRLLTNWRVFPVVFFLNLGLEEEKKGERNG